MNDLTLIVPFYRNSAMLRRQVEEWKKYPPCIMVICVDDGSPEPALPIITGSTEREWIDVTDHDVTVPYSEPPQSIQLYRISVDIPWNREGARNLGAHHAKTEWIIQVDIDHILPADAVEKLLNYKLDRNRWYRFPRWRRGRADATRKKDRLPDESEYGPIHPHVDSYLVRREIYWKTGGYDEDYSGALGGGNAFLKRLEEVQHVELLPPPIRLEVYTRSVIPDASDWSLSRDTSEWRARRQRKETAGDTTPKNPLRFSWVREL